MSKTPPTATEPPEGPTDVTSVEVTREIRDFERRHERRRRLAPRAALVGLFAGLTAAAFRLTLEAAERGRAALFAWAHTLPSVAGFLLAACVCGLAAGASLWLVRRFAPETAGSGIPHLKAVLHNLRGMKWRRVLLVKFASGTLAIGSGLTLGREGPTVQMGGALGQMVNGLLRGTARERQTLIAAGAGAGLAAAFNAPLAGVIFVLEELRRDFAPGALTAGFIASVTADVVSRLLLGQSPVFRIVSPAVPPLGSLPFFLLLGLVTGLLGVLFNRSLLASLRLFARTSRWPAGAAAALVGLAVGAIGWMHPDLLGGGGALVEATLTARMVPLAVLTLLGARFVLTMASYGTGTAGGIFAPLLVLGAQAGLLVGLAVQPLVPSVAGSPSAYAVVGMAALFAAIVRAPLTGIVLIVEMTASYSLMLPLLAACYTAYALADLLGDKPIYEALLERDLLRGRETPEPGPPVLLDLIVEEGAPFDGRRVADLGLPPGCLLIGIRRGLEDLVPSRDTVLQAGDRLSAVLASEAVGGAERLYHGVTG